MLRLDMSHGPWRPGAVDTVRTVAAALLFGFGLWWLAGRLPAAWVAVAAALLFAVVICLRDSLLTALLLVAAMLLSPELRVREGIILRADDLLIPLLGLGLAVRGFAMGPEARLRLSPLDLPVLALLTVHAAASFRGVMAGTVEAMPAVLWNGKVAQMLTVYWAVFNLIRTPEQVRRLLTAALLVFAAVVVYAALQIPDTEVFSDRRLTAPFEGQPEPATLGGYLVVLITLLLAVALHEPRPVLRAGLGLLAAGAVVPLLFTFSRASYVAFVVSVVLLGMVTRRIPFLAVVLLVLALSPLILPSSVTDRVLMTFDPSREYGLDPSLVERVAVWRKVRVVLQNWPLLGKGLPQPVLDSQFARIVIESGLFGLAAWLTVLGTCVRVAWRLRRTAREPLHRGIASGYLVCTAALLVHSLAVNTLYIVRIAEPFWLLTGVVLTLDAHSRHRVADPVESSAEPMAGATERIPAG